MFITFYLIHDSCWLSFYTFLFIINKESTVSSQISYISITITKNKQKTIKYIAINKTIFAFYQNIKQSIAWTHKKYIETIAQPQNHRNAEQKPKLNQLKSRFSCVLFNIINHTHYVL